MGVGIRLKMALREKKMTIKELSACSSISLNTLYSITKRDSENVDDLTLCMISGTIGLSQSFFCSSAPFEDLTLLDRNKESILSLLVSEGLLKINGRDLSDIGTFEYWSIISGWVRKVSVDESGAIKVQFGDAPPIDLYTDKDKYEIALLAAFRQLAPSGRQLVIEYAELLASNPGFRDKSAEVIAD